MSWQRFNRTSNVFEVSDNNGASWQTLVIAAAGLGSPALPANIAYTHLTNNFTARQLITGGAGGTGYYNGPLELQCDTPRVSFHWPGVVASQIGMDSAGTIRTYDNPGTGYAAMAALNFYASSTSNNFGDLTIRGATNFMGGINVTAGSMTVTGNIQNTGSIYPGNVVTGGYQSTWVLGSHSSYGLYSNTGLYLSGGLVIGGGGASIAGTTTMNAAVINSTGLNISAGGLNVTGQTTIAGYTYINTHPGSGDTSIMMVNTGAANSFRLMSYAEQFRIWRLESSLELLALDAAGAMVIPGPMTASGFDCKRGIYGAATPGAAGHRFNFYWTGSGIEAWIDATNMGVMTTTSDARIKRDFTPLVGSLDKVRALRPGSFYYTEGEEQDQKHLGMLAQEVLEITPEVVRHNNMVTPKTPDGMYMMNYSEMVPLLIGAIQELDREIHHA